MSEFTVKLLTGLAELLDAAGVGDWSPSTPADAGALPAITLVHLPQTPERVICLSDYGVDSSARLTDTLIGVQVRVRGDRDPRTASDVADLVYDALHALAHVTLGTAPNQVLVTSIAWQSESPIGPDESGRFERSINYYVSVNRTHDRLE